MAISYGKEKELPWLAKPQTGAYICYRRVVAGLQKLRRDESELYICPHKRERECIIYTDVKQKNKAGNWFKEYWGWRWDERVVPLPI